MNSINDSVLLMMVGMLNFLGAILLAHARVSEENVEGEPFPPFPVQVQGSEIVRS